eukprot:CAMPEP_0167743278 /NCGR_PEP_ID=MMETSP0110_2-20121227/1925_1 /TAXON_ID=629695 /ORGANISM="Gymnochlora sp., Strain CCMP2014" /LENGTH=340 /DNA_ID=CAMNT_0007627627 /DNA_START=69 /DNA_END=1091 /DNA_ORIENTATION=-
MTSKMMRAVLVSKFGGPEVLKVGEVSIPKPKAGELLVKTLAVGINPVETYKRGGGYKISPKLPYTPGTEGCGVVVDVGSDVKDFKVGDKVWQTGSLTGTYAQYNICPSYHAWKLPKNYAADKGAAISLAFRTAYRALMQKANAKPKQTVFIHGASGGVGLAAVQIARTAGLKVLGSAGTEEGRKLILDTGCHVSLNHREKDRKNYLSQIKDATNGKGADIIIEMLANRNLNFDMEALAKGGRIVVVGNRGEIDGVNCRLLMQKEASVTGCMLPNFGSKDPLDETEVEAIAAIQAGIKAGFYQPIVGTRFPLDKAADAHVEVMEHKTGSAGKIILTPWEEQ